MSRKTAQTVFVLLGLIIVGSAVYLYMLIGEAGDHWPAENEPGSLTRDIGSLKSDVNRLSSDVARIPDAQETLEAITVDFELASRVLPRESTPDQLLAAIRTKAQQAGVSPSSLSPSVQPAGRGGGNFETWTFSVSLTGTYDQLATFINRMEEFDSADASRTGSEKRFFEVKSLNITAREAGMANLAPDMLNRSAQAQHDCVLTMQTYRYTGQ